MARFRNFQTNFSGGLLSEGMLGRVDLAQYENGCKQLDNWWPKVTGGVRRRPGSRVLSFVDDAVRVESFIFSEDQTYLVVFRVPTLGGSQNNILFFDTSTGNQVASINISGIAYTAEEIKQLSITQAGDTMFVAHTSYPLAIIKRTSATTFTYSEYEFEEKLEAPGARQMPFWKFDDFDVTIECSQYEKGKQVTLTASEAIFKTRHVGRLFRYRGKQIFVSWVQGDGSGSDTAIGNIKEDLDRGAVLTFNSSTDSPEDYSVGEIVVGRDSGTKAEVIETSSTSIAVAMIAGTWSLTASEDIEGLTSGNIAQVTGVANVNPLPSRNWDEEAFTPDNGYPAVVAFHSQRLWLGGSSSLPAHIFGSRVAAFFNFDTGDGFPADSIQVAISGQQVNQVVGFVSGRHLQVFTDAGEFYSPSNEDRPLVPETFDLLKQTRFGSKRYLEPKIFDEATLFVQAQGNAVREFIFVDGRRGYSSEAVSLVVEEYLSNIQELEVLYGGYDRPEQIAFFVNGDGNITWYHAARSESIRAWGQWKTQGDYKSLTVVNDSLYALVDRPTDSGTAVTLERFEMDLTLDAAYQDTDTAKSLWTFATSRYSDMTVQAVSGVEAGDPDYYLGEYVVSGGNVVDISPLEVDNITVGLSYTSTLECMPIEVKDRDGVSGGLPKRLISADIYLASTLACQLEGNRVLTFYSQDDLEVAPNPITGVRKFWLLGYDSRPTLTVEHDVPLPCEVLSMSVEVEY